MNHKGFFYDGGRERGGSVLFELMFLHGWIGQLLQWKETKDCFVINSSSGCFHQVHQRKMQKYVDMPVTLLLCCDGTVAWKKRIFIFLELQNAN